MEKNTEIKNNTFKEENKILNRAKKGDLTTEELTSAYEKMLSDFKLISSISRKMSKSLEKVISEKDIEISNLEKKLVKANKLGYSTSILLTLSGLVIATLGIILM